MYNKKHQLEFLNALTKIVHKCIKLINNSKKYEITTKSDGSPVTKIDLEVDNIIFNSLNNLKPNIPIISEERSFNNSDFSLPEYFLIDPIDGTRSFINGGNEYTVNIALIKNGNPIVGLIGHPPSSKVWVGGYNNIYTISNNGRKKDLRSLEHSWNKPIIIASHFKSKETSNFYDSIKYSSLITKSSSIKFCMLAEGLAHLYPRFSIINKWDIAAGHAIINASGGCVQTLDYKKMVYNSETSQTSKFIAACSKEWKNKVNLNN